MALGSLATWWIARLDAVRVTTVLFYDLDEQATAVYQRLHGWFDAVAASGRVWHVCAQGNTADWKRNAGASHVVQRVAVCLHKTEPKRVRTNIEILAIPVGRQTLYLFPDRVLVFESGSVGAVGYDALSISVTDQRFIEEE